MTIIEDKDLPARMKMQQHIAHEIAEQAFKQTWNFSLSGINKDITGNDLLSYFATILCDFSGRWIAEMDKIRLADDAGITREDLIKETISGILATIGCAAEYEQEKPLPYGIKRL